MTLDEFLIIACLVGAVAFRALYQYLSWNVYLRYQKDRKERLYAKFTKESGRTYAFRSGRNGARQV